MIPALTTPFGAALFHLMLIGVPLRFGFLPIGLFRERLGLPPPCSLFEQEEDECTPLESFMMRDSGYRFVLHYELAFVACFVMAMSKENKSKKDAAMCRFHQILILTSFLTVIAMALLQHFGGEAALEQDFFARTVLFNLLAILISSWTIHNAQDPNSKSFNGNSSWSIPGCALMTGAAGNFLVVMASIQLLLTQDKEKQYFVMNDGDDDNISLAARTGFELGILHTVVHTVTLVKLREIMSTAQLKTLCLYKLIVSIVLPMFWFPELSEFVNVYVPGTSMVRAGLACVYALGYAFAGKAEKVSKILTSEKAD